MVRAMTSEELEVVRRDGQGCRLYLAVHRPAVVFAARVNQTFNSLDGVAEVVYDTVTVGAYTDILPDMTLYVGTSAGAYDVGMARIRKAADATKIYIGETSEINFANDLYLTVVDEFSIWQRHLRVVNESTIYMDYEEAYSDQHAVTDAVPVLGPPAVAWLSGEEVEVDFDASESWTPKGTITGYAWTAPGASAVSGENTAYLTATYDAAGIYRVGCTLTTSLGATFTGYRNVFVYAWPAVSAAEGGPFRQVQVEQVRGDLSSGGWSFTLKLYDEATIEEIRDRALVVLFARDWYGTEETSVGPVEGRENLVCVGWIDGESILRDVEEINTVEFEAHTANWWLAKMTGFPVGFEDTDFAGHGGGAADQWIEFEDLTVDQALWQVMRWRTTLSRIMDCYPCGDTRQASALEAPVGDLWGQLTEIATNTILAKPCCDRFGRLFLEIDAQVTAIADRDDIPVVMAVTDNDLWEGVEIERNPVWQTSKVELTGAAYSSGSSAAYGGKSPGSVFGRFGVVEAIANLALASQAQATELAGLVCGMRNNEFGEVGLKLGENNRMMDVTPRQYLTYSLLEGDTERGFVWTNKRLIPRAVEFVFDGENGILLTNVTCEVESPQIIAQVMTFPGSEGDGGGGGGGGTVTPPIQPPQPPAPPPPTTAGGDAEVALELIIKITDNIYGEDEDVTWTTIATVVEE